MMYVCCYQGCEAEADYMILEGDDISGVDLNDDFTFVCVEHVGPMISLTDLADARISRLHDLARRVVARAAVS